MGKPEFPESEVPTVPERNSPARYAILFRDRYADLSPEGRRRLAIIARAMVQNEDPVDPPSVLQDYSELDDRGKEILAEAAYVLLRV